MKTIKSGLLILLLTVFTFSILTAQEEKKEENKNKMFNIHIDNVRFDKMMDYEKVAKELKDNMVKHSIQDASWTTISTEDGRYIYVSEIESMADLDKNPMSGLFDKMGDEAAGKMFDTMNECYDSHGNHISYYIDSLSYHPESEESSEDKNYLEYHFLYYPPRNSDAIGKAMKAVKDLFVSKNIKNGYSVYHSGFGSDESYFIITVRGKDGLEIEKNGKINDEAFGDESQETFFNVIKLTSKYDQVDARIRPELSYYPTKN